MKIENETQLIENLQEDVRNCGKKRIVVQAGHFPLLYFDQQAVEGIKNWGQFSPYTLELGCKIGKFAKESEKEVKFVFFVDDHSYEPQNGNAGKFSRQRNKLYRQKSGLDANAPPEYQRIMSNFGFSEMDVLRHDHNKSGRKDCLYFSEKILRSSSRDIANICAREYAEFIENPHYFDKGNSHIVSFVPNRCKRHICEIALDEEIQGLSASHVFMDSMNTLATRKELYETGRGVSYRRN